MIGFAPLIADFGDVLSILVFIVIGLGSVIAQIISKAKEERQKAGPGARPRPQPRQHPGPLADEIDQFVGQAAQRRAEGRPQPVAQRQGARPQPAPHRPTAVQSPVEAVPVELLQPLTDENLEQPVRRLSDPKVVPVSSPPGENAEGFAAQIPPTAAAGLAAMLADPTNVRQAIVLSEILQRPESRWS